MKITLTITIEILASVFFLTNGSLQGQIWAREINKNNSFCFAELDILMPQLLEDLPHYANRVSQRSKILGLERDINTYIIIAGQPEYQPLPLQPPQSQYPSVIPGDTTQQIFFTTLERQYSNNQVSTLESYHWLFLTKSEGGWRVVMLFSVLGATGETDIPLPPRETTQGIIGQGIQLWLRDCRAGELL